MKRSIALILIIAVLFMSVLACGVSAPSATPDIGAAVETSVAATAAAQVAMQATIDASVAATAAAAPAATPPVEVIQMTEEELAALIDQAVAEALAASEQTSTAAAQATTDGAVDETETQAVYETAVIADEAVMDTLELIYAYEELYCELAEEALAIMQELENDLNEMDANLDALVQALNDINASLEQGLEVATETIEQLQATAQAAYGKAQDAQANVQGYVENLPAQLDGRVSAALEVQPDNLPTDLQSSVEAAFAYLDTTRQALVDNKLSGQELQEIARLGANASAGLQQFGGAKLSSLAEVIGGVEGITAQLARGQVNFAMQSLGGLEQSLGQLPGGGRRRP